MSSLPHLQTLIIGSGPAALAVALQLAARLPGSTAPDRLRVIDPLGAWLSRWHHQMAAQRIPHLRSPAVHHPGPHPFDLVRAVDPDRDLVRRDRIHLPRTAAFARFCDVQIGRAGLADAVVADQVERIDPLPAGGAVVTGETGAVRADRVVVACNPRRPVWPAWARDPALGASGAVLRGGGLQRRDRDGRPVHAGRRVAVVGGGLSAAHLARGAAADGADVVLLARRTITERRMDVDPRWLGPALMAPFERSAPADRRACLDQARGGGSMPAWAVRALDRLVREGAVRRREGTPVLGALATGSGIALQTAGAPEVVDEVWLATGAVPDVRADPALAHLLAVEPVPLHDGLPELRADLGWGSTTVHVVGALAGLVVGPIAGNLAGHRDAAHRVVSAWVG